MSAIEAIANRKYKYGFVTEIESDVIPRGLNEDVVRMISEKKNEPEWMLEWRLKAYRHWLKMEEPVWANVHYPKIDYQDIIYYSAPKQKDKKQSLDEVDPQLLETFEKLGIPLHEQKLLTNVAVDAIFDSVSVATTFKEKLAKEGVVFCSFSEAVRDYPELVRKYIGSVVPYTDNFFATLNSAVFSDGSFCYIPKGVRCPMELSSYFRINNSESGQFERTLIIAEEGAYVSYLEGCHPAGEQVSTPNGWVNIESLKPGDVVYDHEGDPQKVRAVMTRHHKGEMITIRPVSRYNSFRLTPEHPVLAIKGADVRGKAEPEWIKAGELQTGDFVLVPKSRAKENEIFSDEEIEGVGQEGRLMASLRGHKTMEIVPGYASLPARSLGERPIGPHQARPDWKRYLSRSGSNQYLFGRDCSPEAMRTQGGVVRETETHFIVPIREIIREPWDDLVFNTDVENTHSYLVRGVAVHNCTAPKFDKNQLHAAVVELVALDNAEIKYSTVQNWYAGDEEGRGGIYNFVTKRGKCAGVNSKISWTQVETGSAITWKYPSCILQGDNSIGEFYSVALTNHRQQADTGTKMIHIGKNTRSRIISKGISAGLSNNSYRGLVKILPKAENARNYSQCDSLLIGGHSGANTFPYIEVGNNSAKIEHEASTSKISEEQIFYFNQRGVSTEDAVSMIINGFCKEVFRELPMEFAVEATRLLGLKLEGSVG
jgi:Fe-S cluster assembly scaffold protein SufB